MSKKKNIKLVEDINMIFDIDQYQSLGEGSYGKVYIAVNKLTKEVKALKEIDISKCLSGIKYILKEVSIGPKLVHKHLLQFQQVYIQKRDDETYAKMKVFIETEVWGRSLDLLMKTRVFSENEIKIIIYQCLDALEYLHSHQIMHRDIKEKNILVNEVEGKINIKICDFGFIKQFDPYERADNTNNVGTQSYRSPEMCLKWTWYFWKVDMWALGVVFVNLVLQDKQIFAASSDCELLKLIVDYFGKDKLFELDLSEMKHLDWSKMQKKYSLETLIEDRLSTDGIELLLSLLEVDPFQRLDAKKALNHEWLSG